MANSQLNYKRRFNYMKTRSLVIAFILLAIPFMAGCASAVAATSDQKPAPAVAPSQASTAQSLPVSNEAIGVVQAYMDTANTGDFDKTLAFYADDAVVYNPLGVFVGKAEISKWLTDDVKTTRATAAGFMMQGSLVIVTGTVSLARFQNVGIGEVAYRAEYMVDGGKIRFFAPAVQLTPDQQSRMKTAQAKAPAAPTPQVNPEDLVKAYVEAANSGDFDKTISFYSDDAAALVMNNTLLLSGKDQISSWLKGDVQTTHAIPQDWQVNGNIVINTGMVSLARFTKLGISQVQYQSIYVVENGKIRFFRPTLILTSQQQAAIQAAQPTGTKGP
jgi:ketosteroid isomerase-like protein